MSKPDTIEPSNVVQFTKRIQEKYGDHNFLICACQSEVTYGMLPVAINDAQGPFICALVCPECGEETPISFGRPA